MHLAASSVVATACATALLLASCQSPAPVFSGSGVTWQPSQSLDGGPSLRGVAAVSSFEAWVSGSSGTIAHTQDGGQSWHHVSFPQQDLSELDFRDFQVLDCDHLLAMSAGPGELSRVLRSEDGGKTWQETARNTEPEGFWDGMAFWDEEHGLMVGDPLEGRITLYATSDGGRSWALVPEASRPRMAEGEYCFAASGTSLALQPGGLAWLVTGGSRSQVWRSTDGGRHWQEQALPLVAGSDGAGAFSVAFRDSLRGVVVGGDYLDPEANQAVAAWTEDGGRQWQVIPAAIGPRGYRSAVAWLPEAQVWWCTGPGGSEWSRDGRTWHASGADGMHAIDAWWMSGASGQVLRAEPVSAN
jgi:photosystem II stability/assembly factor-like uncharacterized protein